MIATLCLPPLYFPESFEVYEHDLESTMFLWLVPITREELQYVREGGGQRFQELLVERDPDLLDLARESIV